MAYESPTHDSFDKLSENGVLGKRSYDEIENDSDKNTVPYDSAEYREIEDSKKPALKAIHDHARIFVFKDTMIDMCTSRVLDNMEATPVKELEDVLGLESAKTLLNQLLVAPSVNPEVFQDECSPGNFLNIFGLRGVGKRTLVYAFCKFYRINLIEVGRTYSSDVFIDLVLNAAEFLRPCVIYFNHLDGSLFKNNMSPSAIGCQIGYFYPQHEQRGKTSGVWLVFGSVEIPHSFHDFVRERIGSNHAYAEPPDESSRAIFINNLCGRMWGPNSWVGPVYNQFLVNKVVKQCSSECTFLEILKYFKNIYQKRMRELVRTGQYRNVSRYSHALMPLEDDIAELEKFLEYRRSIVNRDIKESTKSYTNFLGISEALSKQKKIQPHTR